MAELNELTTGKETARRRRLAQIDWDFTTEQSESEFSAVHWHPCRFPSQIAAVAIGKLSNSGDLVLDPFMGSATTLVEAKRLGRRSVGIDLNPISCLMAEAKLLDEPSQKIVELIDRFTLSLTQNWNTAIESPVPDAVQAKKWYAATTLAELRKIWGFVEGADQRIQKILRSAFSAVLLPSCKETRHWGYVCDNSSPKTSRVGEAKRLYLRALKRFQKAYLSRWDSTILSMSSRVVQGDSRVALRDFEDGQVDCFVTSPLIKVLRTI